MLMRATLPFVVLFFVSPHLAFADDSSATFFANGQRLMKEKKFDEACPEFEKALALNPGAGTKFNLADCYEKTKRPASALTLFREVESVTRQVAQRERSAAAKERADALETRVPTIIVRAAWASSMPQVALTLDGKALPFTSLEQPIKVDLGKHVAIARLGANETKAEGDISKEGQSLTLALEAPSGKAGGNVAQGGTTSNALAGESPSTTKSSGSTQRTVGYVVGGAGIVATAIGAVVMLSGKGNYDDESGKCPDGKCVDTTQRDKVNGYRSDVNLGGAVMTIGVVAIAAGVVLWLTAPKGSETSARFSPSKNGLSTLVTF